MRSFYCESHHRAWRNVGGFNDSEAPGRTPRISSARSALIRFRSFHGFIMRYVQRWPRQRRLKLFKDECAGSQDISCKFKRPQTRRPFEGEQRPKSAGFRCFYNSGNVDAFACPAPVIEISPSRCPRQLQENCLDHGILRRNGNGNERGAERRFSSAH